ncbi:MAG: hypothetical protein PWQ52_30 [Methanolobus sp.]|nr:hypothetical protein [Methanolobus sp.]MDK2833493.1 hypothetical protein [Methanolobus sp.]
MIALVRPALKNGPVKLISAKISALGYSPEDFSSGELTYEDIIDPQELPGVVLELLENVREGAHGLTLKYRVKTKSGELMPVEEHTFIQRNESGEPAYYTTVIMLPD